MDRILAAVIADPQSSYSRAVKTLNTSFHLRISGEGGGDWLVDCREPFRIEKGSFPAECVISLSDRDFHLLVKGSLNPQAAFVQGRISVSGDIEQALKFPVLLESVYQEKQ